MVESLVDNPSAAANPALPDAFVTLLTADSYLPGALALLHALHELHPAPRNFKIACLVTPQTVDAASIGALRNAGYDVVIGVEPIASGQRGQRNLHLMGRLDLDRALTKLHIFRLGSMFKTVFYMDADTLPIRPLSHLFHSTAPHTLSACPDIGWPDCFNSGVMVIRPRLSDFENLRQLMVADSSGGNGSFDGADQGLLNHYFSEEGEGGPWHRLPFTYNVTPSAAYQYMPAFKRFAHKISVIHFIGPRKPWSRLPARPAGLGIAETQDSPMGYEALIDRWFDVYDRNVRPSAIHEPNLAKRFTVPENVAVWNRPHIGEEVHPSASVANLVPVRGQYTSLPLDGRYDLMMPEPEPELKPDISPPPTSQSHLPHATESQQDQREARQQQLSNATEDCTAQSSQPSPPEQAHSSPSERHEFRQAAWDGSRGPPPKDSQPEMAKGVQSFYVAAWDEPTRSQGTYYQDHHDRFTMPTLPNNVRENDWYGDYTRTIPDPKKSGGAFPWEEKGRTALAKASRKFPQERLPTPPPAVASKTDESITTVLPPDPVQLVPSKAPEGVHHHASQPSKPIPSFNEAMADYTNAWDADASIGRYAKRLTDLGIATSRRKAGMHTVPPSPRRSSRHLPLPASQKDDNIIKSTTEGGRRLSYEDKGTQTERTPQNDAIVQVSPENSPYSENAPLVRQMVSVATTPVTPPERQMSSQPGPKTSPASYFPAMTSKRGAARTAARGPPRGRVWDPQTDIDVIARHPALANFGR
ncbi:nucleotide-diphospho-sugar transferase [Cutaneotrichosporon oleaginosum]|uniref:Nucleotide-diphospho-sugar transferase n=1 Tax=Cutaneotrichosporon oleaginosum TaxID=879819 RepID=A0A0J0XPZ4_9TREE|nr:nucleotide-diphospho-sugar transferase [Cutaneotrichosporon oleaginosum]KLT43180.1 nucleotide-diphospho-sugar transferase [Cutaneotrichosporon oleaginosum]TXT09862.1 hypothetical protein COLE_03796 [Cutaneotrichosporon oleaginosum]